MPVTMPAPAPRRRTCRARRAATDLEEGRAGVEQPVDALARQQLAAPHRGGSFARRSCDLRRAWPLRVAWRTPALRVLMRGS
jgi:hypothetical protein